MHPKTKVFLLELANLLERHQACLSYTNGDDGIHVSTPHDGDVNAGWLSEHDGADAIRKLVAESDDVPGTDIPSRHQPEAPMPERHPIQPLVIDAAGVERFKKNQIVRDLLDHSKRHGFGLNEIACKDYSTDDRRQLAQLIGYSLDGYSDLSFVDRAAIDAATRIRPVQN